MNNLKDKTEKYLVTDGFNQLKDTLNDQSFLLMIIDIENCRLDYFNHLYPFWSDKSSNEYSTTEDCLFKKIIHPDEYLQFIAHLKECNDLIVGQEKVSYFHILNKEGRYDKHCFIDRIYKGLPNCQHQQIISIAQKMETEQDLLDKKKNHIENLESNSDRYQQILSTIDEAYCIIEMIFDFEGNAIDYLFTENNNAFEAQVVLPNAIGQTMKEMIPDHENKWFEIYGKVVKTGESIRFQENAEKLDNTWLDVYAFKLGGKNSQSVAVMFFNITERKKQELGLLKEKGDLEVSAKKTKRKLRENNDLLQMVFDSTNLGIAVFSIIYDAQGNPEDFKFIRVNEVLNNMYKNVNPLGKTYSTSSNLGLELGVLAMFKRAVTEGKNQDEEFYVNKEGYNNWFRMTARIQDKLLISTIEDITDRKKESQQLEETIRFKQQLITTSPETVIIINLNSYTVRYINKDIYPEENLTKESIQGMPIGNILPYIHPRDREKIMNLHKKLLKSSEDDIYDLDLRMKFDDLEWEWFSVRGKIFHRRDEHWVDEYVLLIRNITNQKNIQKALISAEKLSIQGEIARTLAHELRNPLASIGLATEVIRKKLELMANNEFKNYLGILNRSTKTLNNLVTNLLNSSNYTPAKLKKADLGKIIDITLEKASDRIYLSGIKVVKNYKGSFPILADQEKLIIALLNIVVNASEATTPDKGLITLDIKEHKTDFMLSISDNGHGLEKDQIDHLFEAFYTNKATGVGVGLNSVKSILEEHDAKIKVESKPNLGTTFKIYFHNANLE